MEVRVFRKLVKVGLIDLASIDLKAIHDELIRRGLMDDPNV
jgi:pyruvate-formate lyase-activating enzyme